MVDAAKIRRGSETILVVEDDDGVRDVVRQGLERMGYRVLAASGPGDAIEVATSHEWRIDLLMTDVVLPMRSGPALARHIARLRPGIRLLYMSGFTDESLVRCGGSEGAPSFLKKPFTMEGLSRSVRSALEAA